MNIQAAILCDFAQVREGMLFVASGGVSRVVRPATGVLPFPVHLALVLEIPAHEIDQVHEVRVNVTRDSGAEVIGSATAALQAPPNLAGWLQPGEPAIVPLAIELQPIGIPGLGVYDVRVSVDGEVPTILTVYFVETARPQQPS